MRLIDALQIVRRPLDGEGRAMNVGLACGFTPLHLETFLAAELRQRLPSARIEISTGLFDDLPGNIARLDNQETDAVAVVVEWADIDPRLGLRRLGGWRADEIDEIVGSASQMLDLLRSSMVRVAGAKPVICCLPTLPLPPLFPPHRAESGAHELRLRELIASFAAELPKLGRIRVINEQSLDNRSALSTRRDVKSELTTGFPYTLEHASAVAEILAILLGGPTRKKGLITDLDDTLWAGLVGEIGAGAVTWSLDDHGQMHGLYQQLLASLASAGVLIAVASKNDPEIVDEALARADLLISPESIFPVKASWDRKSVAVRSILQTWNIAASDVVFVDDSPMELAEVNEAFPEITSLAFPDELGEGWEFLGCLRDMFGASDVTVEDTLRVSSIRAGAELRAASELAPPSFDDFLEAASGKVTFSLGKEVDERALELINKTNQFNLNGRRLTRTDLGRLLDEPSAYLVTVGYEDKFGPLGRIAAVVGSQVEGDHVVDVWVMSCRAFSRRLEHHTLAFLFDRLDAEELVLSYVATERNAPFREMLGALDQPGGSPVRLTRELFLARTPPLVHSVAEGDS